MGRGPEEEGRAARRAPRAGARVLVTLGAGLVGLLAVELAMRVLDLGPPLPFEREGDLFQPSEVPAIRFENRPGARQVLTYPRRGAAPTVVEMRVNAQGFRGPEVAREKPPGVLRVACVGDSHTFGWGVPEGESWPDHLRAELARRRPGEPFEVLNCGVNNFDTVQEVAWLEHRVLPFEPDLVVLQFYVNDASVHGVEPAAPRPRDSLLRWTDRGRDGWMRRLRARSRLLDLVADGLYRRRGLAVYSAQRTALFDEDEPGWRQVRAALRRARDLLAEREIAFVVALYPFLVREGDVLTSHRAFELVRAFCAEEQITCVDTEPAFLAEDVEVDELRISPHDYHANAAGHRLFARAICDALERAGLP